MTKLPEPIELSSPMDERAIYGYTADQLKQAVRDALEEAAKIVSNPLDYTRSEAVEASEPAWMPIKTAPKDKTHVALLRQNGDGSVTYGHGFYMPMEGWICWTHYGNKPPTHWMQLPPAPECK